MDNTAKTIEERKQEIIQMMLEGGIREENQRYGEFIIQTNKVQFHLSALVILRSGYPDKKFRDRVEVMTFGALINLYNVCAGSGEGLLIKRLRSYKDCRDRLAHKMYGKHKLTKAECERAIAEGEQLAKALKSLVAKIMPEWNRLN